MPEEMETGRDGVFVEGHPSVRGPGGIWHRKSRSSASLHNLILHCLSNYYHLLTTYCVSNALSLFQVHKIYSLLILAAMIKVII